jgi:quercetin dioxygenase-like cupin family protein
MGADDVALRPGDAVSFPPGAPIRFINSGQGPAEMLVSVSAGFTATMDDGTTMGTPPWAL